MTVEAVTLDVVMTWLDEQSARTGKEKLSPGSIRHNLNLLSRFFSWAVERGHATFNPVRQIPIGKRPQQEVKSDTPWLDDDDLVRKIVVALPEPIDYMFYLGNRSGLRMGESSGLRMSDFDFLDEGVIRVRFSYDGHLKEDKKRVGKLKWVPAPDDCEAFLGPWFEQRRADGAGPEDLVFPGPTDPKTPARKEFIESRWEPVADDLELDLTWYQATRHSFVSRNLKAGVPLDEVSAAIGYSSPVVTKRYYDHFVRKQYTSALRSGLGLGRRPAGEADATKSRSSAVAPVRSRPSRPCRTRHGKSAARKPRVKKTTAVPTDEP